MVAAAAVGLVVEGNLGGDLEEWEDVEVRVAQSLSYHEGQFFVDFPGRVVEEVDEVFGDLRLEEPEAEAAEERVGLPYQISAPYGFGEAAVAAAGLVGVGVLVMEGPVGMVGGGARRGSMVSLVIVTVAGNEMKPIMALAVLQVVNMRNIRVGMEVRAGGVRTGGLETMVILGAPLVTRRVVVSTALEELLGMVGLLGILEATGIAEALELMVG